VAFFQFEKNEMGDPMSVEEKVCDIINLVEWWSLGRTVDGCTYVLWINRVIHSSSVGTTSQEDLRNFNLNREQKRGDVHHWKSRNVKNSTTASDEEGFRTEIELRGETSTAPLNTKRRFVHNSLNGPLSS
jgi:hypothetical protein